MLNLRDYKIKYRPVASKPGVQFNFANFLFWDDVETAKIFSLFGLPYVLVKRKSWTIWIRWWIPLYLSNFEKFKAEVKNFAPPDNPFRIAVESFDGPKVIIPSWVWLLPLWLLIFSMIVGSFL